MLIRADASPEIGTGHVMRCLALAQAWQDAGGRAVFLMAEFTPDIRARLAAENCSTAALAATPGSEYDAQHTAFVAHHCSASWIVIDGYRFGASYQTCLRSSGRQLLCIDDDGQCHRYAADIVLNQNLNASARWYERRESTTQLLLGTHFCLLRREFSRWKPHRQIPEIGSRILVTLGGSTPAEIGARVIEALAGISNVHSTFVVGGSTADLAPLEACAAKFSGKVTLERRISDMAPLIVESDLAVSAAGSTCWELCFLGLPSILISIAENQVPVARELDRQGCALYAGDAREMDFHKLRATVEQLLASRELRERLSRRSSELVDGLGADRVVAAMIGRAGLAMPASKGA
jgi:UDP-2,4-diacetamido-2,4,6-trideoxy-beta-L-altropyranose hydrolase